MYETLRLAFFRLAASGWVPSQWFEPNLPPVSSRTAKTGPLSLEVVSHCWNYSHFLAYQLSSLVLFPPRKLSVTMTVFYCPDDKQTERLLSFFAEQTVPGVTWNWQPLPRQQLFRRAIGRNQAALQTQADWVWFTDCDLMFREGCLDTLAEQLQGRQNALVFPEQERCTELLAEDNPMLTTGAGDPQVLNIDTSSFTTQFPSKATGPLQIAHGDVCRAVGYCRAIKLYQQPVEQFAKCHEDRAFRWLIHSQGEPLPIPGVYRIRHVSKGRYNGSRANTGVRTTLRRLQSWLRENTQ
ncbi:glycosyltransferase family 2 protein [Gilvimarinus agarilyticus]|uniref:glycosyltransferase family 2 protein n=1 Tax=unclassified Gilvimarinus TaxID=2642066 RepID=UPI001C0A00E0|nr:MULTISPECIES: glycosyltransferase family A protein [unclassified Gilvimarinus]MBU2886608.1 glycosyltransferase family 2 protein [Gilvimarinus agarilyticus]MDO6571276.1 glycosyltransferase family A protein [Gilvimarinus sp. 2_MG-2023]MDO6746349.1 glycosyltransferase family A protein [Gilvimarinus sp. 1_MG-2023]